MAITVIPGFRFRATDQAITQALIGRRLTYINRLRTGQGAVTEKRVREGDPQAGARRIILLRQRQPLDLTLIPQSLPTDIKILHDALSLQAELDQAKWCLLGNNVIIMRGEVTVNLFRLAMDGCDLRFSGLHYLEGQIGSPKEWGKSVRQVPIEMTREFLARLNGLTGRHFRLLSSDEYERACYGQIEGVNALLGELWTPCTTQQEAKIVWRMTNGNTSPPNESLDTFKGLRLAEQLAA